MIFIILLINIFITIFSYFDILNLNIIHILKTISFIISLLLSSFYLGLKTKNKVYNDSIKLSILEIIILNIMIILLPNIEYSIKSFILFIIILIINYIGSLFRINKKKANQ